MSELEVTWKRTGIILWAWLWRTLLFAIPLALAVGYVATFFFQYVNIVAYHHMIPSNYIINAGLMAQFGVVFLIYAYVFKLILNKQFKEFKIVLIGEPIRK